MSRSLFYLRRGLFGIAFVGSLGFGANLAGAEPPSNSRNTCSTLEGRTECYRYCKAQGMKANCDLDYGCWCE
jgi:hypothetical protein